MKIEYDVRIPARGYGKYSVVFWNFFDSDHKTMSIEFDTVKDAIECSKAILNAMNRTKIYNIKQRRIKNVIYWEKI